MKRIYGIFSMVMLCLMLSVGFGNAADLGLSALGTYDYSVKNAGVRVQASVENLGIYIIPIVNVTSVSDSYTRYGVGFDLPIYKTGIFGFYGTLTGNYQESNIGTSGFGVAYGGKVVVDVYKSIALTAGYERFSGGSDIKAFNGNNLNAGLLVRF